MSEESKQAKTTNAKRSGLKSKFLSHVKVKRARSFSGREKQKAGTHDDKPKEDTATMSDTEGYTGRRSRPRRRTTGGSEAAADIESARKMGYSSDQDGQSTLNRQQIIAMVKKRFGLRPDESGLRSHPTVPEEEVPSEAHSPIPNSSPKQIKYETLLEKPGTYPTLPRKEEVPQFGSGPQGVIYLQYGDEIKRAMLTGGMNNVEQVRDLFERSFPDKFQDRNNNRKTIYIKDTTCGIFYELDDVKDMANKSHLKILESKPTQNGPIRSHSFNSPSTTYSRYTTSTPITNHTQPSQTYTTSTPLQDHSAVQPADEIRSEGGSTRYTKTTTKVTRLKNGEEVVDASSSHNFERSGSLMDKKKVRLPGLGAKLKTPDHGHRSKDPVEDQLDSLTSMLQEALKTESMDSLPTESSCSSSQYSTGSAEGNGLTSNVPDYQTGYRSRLRSDSGTESLSSNDSRPALPFTSASGKTAPTPPPRASSKLAAKDKDKFSQTLQRDSPSRQVKRDLSQQYGTLPTHSSSRTTRITRDKRDAFPRTIQRTMSAGSSTSGASTVSGASSPVTIRYEGGTNVHDKDQLQIKAQGLRQDLGNLRAQLGQLRQLQTYQAKAFDDMLRNAKDQIVRTVVRLSPVDEPPVRSARKRVHMEEMAYHKTKNEVNRNISELESEVEMLRMDVIQKRGVADSNLVTSLNSQLELVSRQIADLRGNFTDLHDNMKSVMAGELEIIVQGEKFLKEEPSRLDSMVSRCKHVTGTLFTLRKLIAAQVQMQSESQASIGSYEGELDKDISFDSIKSVQCDYLSQKHGNPVQVQRNGETSNKGRTRVRFNDEAKTHYR